MYSLSPKQLIYVDTTKKLNEMISLLSQEEYLCLDTEFHSENRYSPKLMLIQIADLQQNTWIIDPLRIDITPLSLLVKEVLLIMHGAKEDLKILQQRLFIQPKSIFDTQIAASMLGIYYPTRLSKIIEETLQITTPQNQTLSNWSERPLSELQLTYAAEDVSALPPLFHFFTDALRERKDLLTSIFDEYLYTTLNPKQENDWLQWGVTKTLSPTAINVLARLLVWRETQAQYQNKPPQYILPKNIAIDIARRQPKSLQALKQNRKIHSNLIKNHGNALLSCIKKAKEDPEQYTPFSSEELRQGQAIQMWAHAMKPIHAIDANLLLPYTLALQIVRHGTNALKGWRRHLLLDDLNAFLNGSTSIYYTENRLNVQP